MTLRVVVDTNIVLFQLTPDPRAGNRLWHWFTEGMVRPVLSQYLVDELRGKLALPKFSLTPATQAAIIADYLSFAEFVTDVPASGIENRDPKDTAILDLALAADVDALLSGDRRPPRPQRRVQVPNRPHIGPATDVATEN